LITRRGFIKLAATGFAAAAALLGYGVRGEAMGRPKITSYAFTPRRWTLGLKLRAVLVADIHTSDPWMDLERMSAICDMANAAGGDLILLLGDYVNAIPDLGRPVPEDEIAAGLKQLSAPLGVHAILGNHDYWKSPGFETDPRMMPRIGHAFEKAGISLLVNDATRLEKDGHPFWVAGLADQLALRYSPSQGPTNDLGLDDMIAAMEKVTDEAPLIMLAHEPDIFPQIPDRVSLTLSGHTHGGQVNIFGWSPIMNSRYGTRYRGGHVVENGRDLVVSRGLGCTGVPFRLGAWPEIVVLDLG
jgi:uncharacterized protein